MNPEIIIDELSLENDPEGYCGLIYKGTVKKFEADMRSTEDPFISFYAMDAEAGYQHKVVVRKNKVTAYSYDMDEPYVNSMVAPSFKNIYQREWNKAQKETEETAPFDDKPLDKNIEADLREYLKEQIQIAFETKATEQQLDYFTTARRWLCSKVQDYINHHDDTTAMALFGDDLEYGVTDILIDVLFLYTLISSSTLSECISNTPTEVLVSNGWKSFLSMAENK